MKTRTLVFSIQGVMKAAFLSLVIALQCVTAAAQPVDVLPVRTAEGAQSLNGEWRFKYVPSSDVGEDESFHQLSFDVAGWKTIPVPSHWELHGFAEPEY